MTTFLAALALAQGTPATLTVHLNRTGTTIPPSLYGVFFEEINAAGEGGLYGEMLQNRGIEEPWGKVPGWKPGPGVTVQKEGPNPEHPRSFAIPDGGVVENSGWSGLAVERGARYRVAVWAKGPGDVSVDLGGASISLGRGGKEFRRLEGTIIADADARDARLVVAAKGGAASVADASLMPERLWKGRRNGLRPDLAEKVDAMNPAFVRFPGGCFVEGGDRFEDAFDWRGTVGPQEGRKGIAHSMWGYPTSNGLGFHEYLQWCEDLGAAPLFVVNAGVNHRQVWPMDDMGHWVDYALDAIEYANGPVSSRWGALRAKNGHPKPFGLKYVEIGNENGGGFHGGDAAYAPRYRLIYDAIKAKHPEIVTICNTPLPGQPVETIDEHYYSDPAFFWRNANRYDAYPRTGPKIYVGEYAVTQGCGKGNLAAALGEAAFMAGMERNADVVRMSSYAPLLTNVAMQQWAPDAIPFDQSRSYGTPSYYVQALFANNRPTRNVAVDFSVSIAPAPKPGGGLGLMTWETHAEFRDATLASGGVTTRLTSKLDAARGTWSLENGTVEQTSLESDRFVPLIGTAPAGDYTLSLKARAVSGREGFLIVMDMRDGGQLRWNVGGWGNTATAFERNSAVVGDRVPVRVEPGHWYDVRLERRGDEVRGYLDGKLVQTLRETGSPDLTAVAGVDERAKELVVKVVNGSDARRPMALDFDGARVGEGGRAVVLTGSSLLSENSFDAPKAIAPVETRFSGRRFTFAPRSVTVLRLPIR